MQRHCPSAPFYRVSRAFFAALFALSILHTLDAHAEGGRNDDFPPETDYPDEAYEADPEDADRQEPAEEPSPTRARQGDKKKRPAPQRPKRVERSSLPDDSSSGPGRWSYGFELGSGLNQITPTVDPDREAVGLKQSMLFAGNIYVFRGPWGMEVGGNYAFTPVQEVQVRDALGNTTNQTRSLTSYALLLNLAYRHSINGPSGKFHLLGRVGYGTMAVTQEIETTSGSTPHLAQSNALYLGIGFEARWRRTFATTIDFYQSVLGSGRLAPTDSGPSGYGFSTLKIGNRVRLLTWGDGDNAKSLGAGVILVFQQLKTPTPPAGNKVGGSETFMQLFATGYLAF